jgi:ankyrin repeat protein/catechol 2,3-dioxygenase-like lactoylglutathione lyase family enzyme
MPVEVIGIDHLYLAVRSLERSEVFYDRVMLQVLGYRKGRSLIDGEPHAHYFNRHFGFSLRTAHARTPDHDPYAPGMHHVCFRVLDERAVDRAAAELRALGIETSAPRSYPEYATDYYALFFVDPDGIRLEITNFREQRRQRMFDWEGGATAAASRQDFIAAVQRGDRAAVEAALAAAPRLAATRDDAGVSVVCLAVYAGHDEIAHLLRGRRADLDIFEASALGDARRVAQLLDAHPELLNAFSADGHHPLGLACFFGRRDVFDLLLANGADLEAPARNAMQVRPLHSAAAHRDPALAVDLVRRLLAAGASPNVRQQGGFTPLHEAALRGHAEMVAVLRARGADTAARTDAGKTALDLARERGRADVVRVLEGGSI